MPADPSELLSYNWPGNVRELRNVIERAVILARGGALHFDLPITGAPGIGPYLGPQAKSQKGSPVATRVMTEVELRSLERDNLRTALQTAKGKIRGRDGAAELLGIKPTTLLARMKKWGVNKPTREF